MALLLGPLELIAAEPHVTDIAVTSDGRVWADNGDGMHERFVDSGLKSPQVMRDFAVRLCAQLGRRLDDSCPIADASTPDGVRIHAVIAPIVSQGAAISIRLPDLSRATLDDLCANGTCPKQWEGLLQGFVETRSTILISGGTGSGKTTLLKALLGYCSEDERIITVEEIRELGSVPHKHCESLVVREPNIEGAGAVTLEDLVKATVRMRPDRIVLGECRGEEISDLLRAFNSGHRGGMVTIHADSIDRIPARFSALGLLAGIQPQATALMAQEAFDCIIHMSRVKGKRFISQIGYCCVDGRDNLEGRIMARWDGKGEPWYSSEWGPWASRRAGAGAGNISIQCDTGCHPMDCTTVLPAVRRSVAGMEGI